MKSLMLRLLTIILLSSTILLAQNTNNIESKLINFIDKAVNTGKNYKFVKAEISHSEDVPNMKGWKAYFLKMDLQILSQKRNISVKDIIFSNGQFISKDFINMNTGRSIKSDFSFPASAKLYDDTHFLLGNKNAKNKLILFSDPLCPFCMDFVPDLVNFVEKHPKQFALYYYYFPLSIHPGSQYLVRAILATKKIKHIKDLDKKVYSMAFDFPKASEDEVINQFNKAFDTNLTKAELNTKDITERINYDMKVANDLMVRGTPTLYVNGKKDPSRSIYKKLVKE
ncbi:MAG: thioredoxin domain-containing protein [Sulfurospirillaceae bacterium]|nr:thioredoxin domain-containing protein [Sulfurospirillaceae bacterium]